ncbi:hypothetical protein EON81_05440 [bacterium]|nr:MAG: hypothetical protein EON81_05440 [bacterium]
MRLNNDDPLLAGIDYPFVRGRDGGYAGTWGIDDGNLYVVDEGTDVALGGESAAKMSNPETLVGFQGLRGLQGAVLRLTIEPVGPGDVVLDWPVFERVQGHPEVRHLDRNRAVLMWPDGPAILWGTHLTYVPDEGLYWPWLPKALGTRNSLADALQWIYAIFEATDPGDVTAFDNEVQGWYDDFEVSLRNIGSADRQSLALLLPKGEGETIRFAIAQTIAEVPPMALWPMRARDNEWRSTGDPAQEQWDQAQEINYIVAPVAPLVLLTPGGVPISTAAAAPAGWAIQEYTLPLSGDEASDYRLVQAGKTFGALYPWRGWWWLGTGPEEGASRGIFASQTFDGRYLRSRVGSDEPPIFGGTTVGAPTAGNWEYDDPIASAPDAIDDASHSIDAATGRVWFFAEIDGEIREAWSDDDGRTFGGWTSLGIGMRPLTGQNNGDLLTIWFVPDGDPDGPGRLVGRFRGLGDESAEEFDLLWSPSEGAAAGALRVDGKDFHGNPVGMRDAQGRWALSVYIEGDSAVSDLASFDGKGETWLKVG